MNFSHFLNAKSQKHELSRVIELNCLGMLCPRPIIETAKAISNIQSGEQIKLNSDDPATWFDLKAWSRMTRNNVAKISEVEFLITKED
ncbi:MAG: hypothetical protein F2734_02325 [Actinobacteria bacterium]|nr:hypothetical protein [Actinomycetota bacterium]